MEIKLKYIKKGKCQNCREPDNLYKFNKHGKGWCESCIVGYLEEKYKKEIWEKEIGKDLILFIGRQEILSEEEQLKQLSKLCL